VPRTRTARDALHHSKVYIHKYIFTDTFLLWAGMTLSCIPSRIILTLKESSHRHLSSSSPFVLLPSTALTTVLFYSRFVPTCSSELMHGLGHLSRTKGRAAKNGNEDKQGEERLLPVRIFPHGRSDTPLKSLLILQHDFPVFSAPRRSCPRICSKALIYSLHAYWPLVYSFLTSPVLSSIHVYLSSTISLAPCSHIQYIPPRQLH
jgi:hypothetical protein